MLILYASGHPPPPCGRGSVDQNREPIIVKSGAEEESLGVKNGPQKFFTGSQTMMTFQDLMVLLPKISFISSFLRPHEPPLSSQWPDWAGQQIKKVYMLHKWLFIISGVSNWSAEAEVENCTPVYGVMGHGSWVKEVGRWL